MCDFQYAVDQCEGTNVALLILVLLVFDLLQHLQHVFDEEVGGQQAGALQQRGGFPE